MGSSNQVTQNGNTTRTWTLSGSGVSNHDTVVIELDNTTPTTAVELMNVRGFINPNRYVVDVKVIGADAVAFRLNNSSIS